MKGREGYRRGAQRFDRASTEHSPSRTLQSIHRSSRLTHHKDVGLQLGRLVDERQGPEAVPEGVVRDREQREVALAREALDCGGRLLGVAGSPHVDRRRVGDDCCFGVEGGRNRQRLERRNDANALGVFPDLPGALAPPNAPAFSNAPCALVISRRRSVSRTHAVPLDERCGSLDHG